MDNTVLRVLQTVIGQAKILGVLLQGIYLILGDRVLDRLILVQRGDIVIRHTGDLLRTEWFQSSGTQSGECLRAGDLMAVEPIDV